MSSGARQPAACARVETHRHAPELYANYTPAIERTTGLKGEAGVLMRQLKVTDEDLLALAYIDWLEAATGDLISLHRVRHVHEVRATGGEE